MGAPGRTAGGKALSRSLAAREIVLGAGTLMATTDPGRLRMWLAAGAFGDCVDALSTAVFVWTAEMATRAGHTQLGRGRRRRWGGGGVPV